MTSAAIPTAQAVAVPASPAALPPSSPQKAIAPAVSPEIFLVEYVNVFWPHCRATHARLEAVLRGSSLRVRRHRVYVWSSATAPLWAQACVSAAAFAKEDALFEELLHADDASAESVWRAAARAGIDAHALWEAIVRGDALARLDVDRQRAVASEVHRLPTIDVGDRRLEGEQTEPDLQAAIRASAIAACVAADTVRGSPR